MTCQGHAEDLIRIGGQRGIEARPRKAQSPVPRSTSAFPRPPAFGIRGAVRSRINQTAIGLPAVAHQAASQTAAARQ